jgi:hypothetical protein
MYAGVSVRSTSVSGAGEKHVGFDSAAVAIMTECASTLRFVSENGEREREAGRTGDVTHALRVLEALAVPVRDDRDVFVQALDEVHDLAQPLDLRGFAHPLVPRPAVHRQRGDTRPHDALDELQRVLLTREKSNLRRERDARRKCGAQSTEDVNE